VTTLDYWLNSLAWLYIGHKLGPRLAPLLRPLVQRIGHRRDDC
jgi:hypothetical protein